MTPAIAMTIGGSDSSGGAGIQADIKTFTSMKVYGCSAISCVTAQNSTGVSRVDALSPEALSAQITAVLTDLPVAALKTGMLLNVGLIEATAAALAPLTIPKLIDPVMVSRAGSVLLEPSAIAAYLLLLPQAELLTPNTHNAEPGQPALPGCWQQQLQEWVASKLALGETDILADAMPQFERIMLETALEHTHGHKQEAARLLGWGRNTLTRKLKELDLS